MRSRSSCPISLGRSPARSCTWTAGSMRPASRQRLLKRGPMVGRDAILFPGQGSQHDQMRDQVARAAPDLLELATELTGADPFEHLDAGTRYVQPAILCASLASWRRWA